MTAGKERKQCERASSGSSDLEVSALGLGCMGLSFGLRPGRRQAGGDRAASATAVERGVTFFDTAEVYGPFTNEELVGEALAPFREQVVIATKFGFDQDGELPGAAWTAGRSTSAQVAEASLKRLKTDRIDLFYQHRVDPNVPIEDVAGAVKDLIRRGQGQALRPLRGGRADDPSRPRRPAGHRAPERVLAVVARARGGVLPTLEELGIGFVPFSPLGKGFLTGKIDENTTFDSDDFRNIVPRFSPEARKANQALVDLLASIAAAKRRPPPRSRSPGSWPREPWIVPIPGTTKPHRLKENVGAAAVELTADDLRRIEDALDRIRVQGDRYPAHLAALVGK